MQDKGVIVLFVCLFVCALLAEQVVLLLWYCIFSYRINLL